MICNLCPKKCGAVRDEVRGEGACRLTALPRLARVAPHMWEEPCISGEKGSGAVFFSGCTMRCVFCQNYEISAENLGRTVSVEQLAEEFRRLEDMGVHNINLVSPTPYVPAIIRAFALYRPRVPVVYNCSGYERVETLRALKGIVDVWLPDFKYSDNALGERYSGVKNYKETALNAISEMVRQSGKPVFDDDGMIQSGVIVRHLVLPNHTRNSLGAIDLLNAFSEDILISLMGQYIPMGVASRYPELNRKITAREYEKVKNHLFSLDLDGFVQELSSADKKYVPKWEY